MVGCGKIFTEYLILRRRIVAKGEMFPTAKADAKFKPASTQQHRFQELFYAQLHALQ